MRVSQLIALLQDVDKGKDVYIYSNEAHPSTLYDILDVDELSDRVDINLGGKL